MLNLQIDSASGCWTKKRCSQDCCKNFFGQIIESDARAFQSSLKCRFFDPSWQHSIRESRTYFNVFFDPYEIENVKQKNTSKRSNLICCRGQVQRPFSCDSLAVRRILVLLMTSNEPNEHRQLGQLNCKRSNSSTTPSFLVKRSTSFCTTASYSTVQLI